jgi:hypothetical protein
MTEESAAEDRAVAGEHRNESFWASFNRADAKLFLITFAGTVAANVVTVMTVAVAIIVARLLQAPAPSAGVNVGAPSPS